jgi:uncharacterized protein
MTETMQNRKEDATEGLRPWREAVYEAARRAARTEDRARCRGADREGAADCEGAADRAPTRGDACSFAYRWEHVQAVARLAVRLAELTGADRDVVEAAAWLHDVAKAQSRQNHGREGAEMARRILAATDFPAAKIGAVAEAIAKHVGLYSNEPIAPLEAAVVWDADKLSKVGATAILHFTGYELCAHHERLEERVQARTAELLASLVDAQWQERMVASLNTAPARAAGQRRLQTYRAFCRQAARELEARDLGD